MCCILRGSLQDQLEGSGVELLNETPNNFLVKRDELARWLRNFEKDGHENARSFYLEAWDGNGRFTYDRIDPMSRLEAWRTVFSSD
jgi:hypothetical protein